MKKLWSPQAPASHPRAHGIKILPTTGSSVLELIPKRGIGDHVLGLIRYQRLCQLSSPQGSEFLPTLGTCHCLLTANLMVMIRYFVVLFSIS